jgi:hypothetical protein
MAIQFQRIQYLIAITLVALVLVSVMPVSAVLINGYYKVAPTIHQGATVFIGEQGLNISDALSSANAQGSPTAITTIGWWASAADIHMSSPTVTIDATGRQAQFTVTQAEFDGYEGQWYLVDSVNSGVAKANAGAVFNVKSPKLDLTIRDVGLNNGADVSGSSVPNGTRLQFQIGTNMYTVLSNPAVRSPIYDTGTGINSSGYLDIRVKYENGTTLTKLYDDNNLDQTLIALNVTTQPFTWGRNNSGRGPGIDYVWNTSSYPPGTYIVSVQSKLNNMQSNYLMGTTAYTGRTVSEDKTITLIGGIPVTNTSTQIGIFRPASGYWYFDYNLDGIVDKSFRFGGSTDQIITGNWQGTGRDGIAIFRPASGYWYFDYNLDGIVDKSFRYGGVGDQIAKGDWNGTGSDGIAIFRPSSGYWYFDYNLDGIVDKSFRYGGGADTIIAGNWA